MRSRRFALRLGAAAIALTATRVTAEPQFNPPALSDPYASAPSYLAPAAPNTTTWPIVTTGQRIASQGPGDFLFVGVPDGLGLYKLEGGANNGHLSLLVNHEFTQSQGGAAGPLPAGARASALKLRYRAQGNQLRVNVESGEWATERVYVGDTPALLDPVPAGMSRLCSAYLATDKVGFDRPIFLHGEESESPGTFDGHGGLAFATFEGGSWALPRMGRASWENLVPVPFTDAKTVVFALEDGPSAGNGLNSQLYMYVGEKVPGGANGLATNGLNNGKVYTFVSNDAGRNSEATFNVKGATVQGHWVEVSWYLNDVYFDAATRAANGFTFVRVEDGSPDPSIPGTFYFVTTGSPNTANPFGRLYKLAFDAANPAGGAASLTLLLDGTEGIVSPDNVDINTHGELLICEDPNYNLSTLGLARDSSIWAYLVPTGGLVRVAEVDRAAARAHALAADPGNSSVPSSDTPGGWEASGIIDAEEWLGRGSWLVDVQAHSLRIVPTAETVQGGQLLHLKWLPAGAVGGGGSGAGDEKQGDVGQGGAKEESGAVKGGTGAPGSAGAPVAAGAAALAGAPRAGLVLSASPNPFSTEVAIRLSLGHEDQVIANIYDASGRNVRSLVAGRLPAGERMLTWDGRNDHGQSLGSGVYFIEARAAGSGNVERAKLILAR